MPDVFSNYDWKNNYMSIVNNTYILIYVYIVEKQKLIICNIHNFMYFYKKYPILTLDLNLLNKDMSNYINQEFYDKFTTNPYIRIFSNNKYKNEFKRFSDEQLKQNIIFKLLLYFIKQDQTIITDIQNTSR